MKIIGIIALVSILTFGYVYFYTDHFGENNFPDIFTTDTLKQKTNQAINEGDIFKSCPAGWILSTHEFDVISEGEKVRSKNIICEEENQGFDTQMFLFNTSVHVSSREEGVNLLESTQSFHSDQLGSPLPGGNELDSFMTENIGINMGDIAAMGDLFDIVSEIIIDDKIEEIEIENGLILTKNGISRVTMGGFMNMDETSILNHHVIICNNGNGRFIYQTSTKDSAISPIEIAKSFSCSKNNNILKEESFENTSEIQTTTTSPSQTGAGQGRWSNESPTLLKWGPRSGTTRVQSETDGRANTTTLAALGPKYEAATYCANLTEGGFSDWYLPAKDELWAGYQQYGRSLFPSSIYWSSTESSELPENVAWGLFTSSGSMGYDSKGNSGSVRCLR